MRTRQQEANIPMAKASRQTRWTTIEEEDLINEYNRVKIEGKYSTDVKILESLCGLVKGEEGKWDGKHGYPKRTYNQLRRKKWRIIEGGLINSKREKYQKSAIYKCKKKINVELYTFKNRFIETLNPLTYF